jgi:hypothetical protein
VQDFITVTGADFREGQGEPYYAAGRVGAVLAIAAVAVFYFWAVDLRRLWNAKRLAESAPGLELCLIHDSPEAKMTGVIIDAVMPNAGSLQGRPAGAPSHDACWAACAAEVTRATRRSPSGSLGIFPLIPKKQFTSTLI